MTPTERRPPKARSILVGAITFGIGLVILGVALSLLILADGDLSTPLGSGQKAPAGFAVAFTGLLALGTLAAGVISIVLAGRGDPALAAATAPATDADATRRAPTRVRSIVVGGVFLLLAALMVIAALSIVAKVGGDLSTLVGTDSTRRSLGRVPAWAAIGYIGLYTALCTGFGVLVMVVGLKAARAADREPAERLAEAD